MDYFIENIKETAEAINKMIDRKVGFVDVKRVRRCNHIKASNRSKINFIWRSLRVLENNGVLERNGIKTPVIYRIRNSQKIDIKTLLDNIMKKKSKVDS